MDVAPAAWRNAPFAPPPRTRTTPRGRYSTCLRSLSSRRHSWGGGPSCWAWTRTTASLRTSWPKPRATGITLTLHCTALRSDPCISGCLTPYCCFKTDSRVCRMHGRQSVPLCDEYLQDLPASLQHKTAPLYNKTPFATCKW